MLATERGVPMAEIAPIVHLSAFGRGVIFHCHASPEFCLEGFFMLRVSHQTQEISSNL